MKKADRLQNDKIKLISSSIYWTAEHVLNIYF